jgi:hypothetical protein
LLGVLEYAESTLRYFCCEYVNCNGKTAAY